MFSVEIDGKKVNASVSFYTACIYEAEFQGDIVQDLFGNQKFEPDMELNGSGDVVRIDFTKTNWTVLMKVLWAAIKTENDRAPSYSAWMKDSRGVNLWMVSEVLSAEVADCFFRPETTEKDAEEEK